MEVRYPPPPQKGYISDTCAIPVKTRGNACDTPSTILSRQGVAQYGAKRIAQKRRSFGEFETIEFLKFFGDGLNTVLESTFSNTELSELFCPRRVPGRELSEFLSPYYLCDKANPASFSQNSPSLPQNSARLSELRTVFRPFPKFGNLIVRCFGVILQASDSCCQWTQGSFQVERKQKGSLVKGPAVFNRFGECALIPGFWGLGISKNHSFLLRR